MPKRLDFSVSVAEDGSLCAEDRERLDPGETWSAEHLVLAALCRCTFASLRHHAGQVNAEVGGTAVASGVVTKREEDGRYAFVEVQCGLDVSLEPEAEDLQTLLDRAERDCFISASLTAPVEFEWRVNGEVTPR